MNPVAGGYLFQPPCAGSERSFLGGKSLGWAVLGKNYSWLWWEDLGIMSLWESMHTKLDSSRGVCMSVHSVCGWSGVRRESRLLLNTALYLLLVNASMWTRNSITFILRMSWSILSTYILFRGAHVVLHSMKPGHTGDLQSPRSQCKKLNHLHSLYLSMTMQLCHKPVQSRMLSTEAENPPESCCHGVLTSF